MYQMANITNSQRPNGWLGTLYDKILTYSTDPVAEIEKIANDALIMGIINNKSYNVLIQRTPVPPYSRKSRKEVGLSIGVSSAMVGQLERDIYIKLMRYFKRYLVQQGRLVTSMDSELEELPWDTDVTSTRALKALKRAYGEDVTIGKIVEELENLAVTGKSLKVNRFGHKSGMSMYEAFDMAGINAPKIRVV